MDELLANPLNAKLYHLLLDQFKSVKVANEGEPFVSESYRGIDPKKRVENVLQGGEEYRVCCPKCGDTKHRLYVNHKWGTTDEAGKTYWNHLIHCFNEECDLTGFDETYLKPYVRTRPTLPPGEAPKMEPIHRTEWPGECVPLTKLPSSHPAIEYIRGRKFDPVELVDLWNVRFCLQCPETPSYHKHLVEGRIIVPVYWDGELVGWQARAVDNSEPKYYTMPGLKKRRILYNGQRASTFSVGVLVEGVTDAWRVGPRAMALLGKSVAYFQRELLCALFRNGTLINMLDPDALEDIDRVHRQLKPDQFPGIYKIVKLPDDTDPGESEKSFIYQEIQRQAGVEVS